VENSLSTGKKEESIKSAIEDIREESVLAEPPRLHEPVALVNVDWGTFATASNTEKKKKKKKKKKKGIEEATKVLMFEELPPSPNGPESKLEPEPVIEECPVEPIADLSKMQHKKSEEPLRDAAEKSDRTKEKEEGLDPWDAWMASTAKHKKKGKKSMKSESEIEVSLPQLSESLPVLIVDEDKGDDWGRWGITTIKGDKGENRSNSAAMLVLRSANEMPIIEPPTPSGLVVEDQQDGGLGDCASNSTMKKHEKKESSNENIVENSSPTYHHPTDLDPQPETGNNRNGNWGFSSTWDGVGKKKKKKKKGMTAAAEPVPPEPEPILAGTIPTPELVEVAELTREEFEREVPTKEEPMLADQSISFPGTNLDPGTPNRIYSFAESEYEKCLARAQHLLDGNGLSSCRICRAWLRDVLARGRDVGHHG
jgi:hypothetical protein